MAYQHPRDVTFLFTDIEGSTKLWEREPQRMGAALARHDAIGREAVEHHRGMVVDTAGDGIYAIFADPLDALCASIHFQRSLIGIESSIGIALRVRCGLHAGTALSGTNDFVGLEVNRAARIMSTANGGQILLSQAVVDRVHGRLPRDIGLRDLGSVRLRDLARPERIYQVLHPQLRRDFPALRSLEATPNNLPQQISSFVGRKSELAHIGPLLSSVRLLTLVGPGGIGKTRLALHAAADALDDYPDGVWVADLAAIFAPDMVARAVAQVLGVQEEAGTTVTRTLCSTLQSRQLLLVLDNCEHLITACAELAEALLQAAPAIRILATSREALRIAGEQTYLLLPLSLPDPKLGVDIQVRSDAIQLFVERAGLKQSAFAVTERNCSTVAHLCIQLDGIPLALELAAARVGEMSVAEIVARLTQRLNLLIGGSRTALPRQRTLRAMIDWSYEALSEGEKALFARLSVFAGGWTLDAVEEVVVGDGIKQDEVVQQLLELVRKSLVGYDEQANRYVMLETIREYARECLANTGEEGRFRCRSRDYFVGLAEKGAWIHAEGGQLQHWTELLRQESDNLRAALKWSMDEPAGAEAALRLCGALYSFWWRWGRAGEGRDWCNAALARTSGLEHTKARLEALIAAGTMRYTIGELAHAQQAYDEALLLSRELGIAALEGVVLRCVGTSELSLGHSAKAQALYEQSIAIHRTCRNLAREATSLNCLASLFINDGNLIAAESPLERALELARAVGNREQEAYTVSRLGSIAQYRGDHAVAHARHHQALVIARELGVRELESEQARHLGEVAVALSDFGAGRRFFQEALLLSREQESWFAIREVLDAMTVLATAIGDHEEAAKFLGAAEKMRETMRTPRFPIDQERFNNTLATCRATLGIARYDSAMAAGRSLEPDETIASALTWLACD